MHLRDCSMNELLAQERPLICFGAGHIFDILCRSYPRLLERTLCIADNGAAKQGTMYVLDGVARPILSVEDCIMRAQTLPSILITNTDYMAIYDQLGSIPALDHGNCYIFAMVTDHLKPYDMPKLSEAENIPRIIHYCWFGGGDMPDRYKRWMESWERFCPNYEIKRWDESNYDVTQHPYMYDAYKARMWGFVPDWARLDITHRHGGIYLDTDVEVVRPLDDLLHMEAFCGMGTSDMVNFGVFGAAKGNALVESLKADYDRISFINPDGTVDLTASPLYQTEALVQRGLKRCNELQKVENMWVFPTDALSPQNLYTGTVRRTKNTFVIHHYDASWVPADKRAAQLDRVRKLKKLIDREGEGLCKA